MSKKYYKPKDFPQQDWDNITNVIANPNSKETIKQASSFKDTKDIDKHVFKLEMLANPNETAIGITGEVLLHRIFPFPGFLHSFAGQAEDLHRLHKTGSLLKEYKTILKKNHKRILEENYNKPEKESQEALPQESQSIKDIIQKISNKAGKP